jgi:hypothetical protein
VDLRRQYCYLEYSKYLVFYLVSGFTAAFVRIALNLGLSSRVPAFPPQQVRHFIPIHPIDPVGDYKLERVLDDIRHLYACSGFLDTNPLVSDNYHRATRTVFFTVRKHEGEGSTISTVKVVGMEQGLVDKISHFAGPAAEWRVFLLQNSGSDPRPLARWQRGVLELGAIF